MNKNGPARTSPHASRQLFIILLLFLSAGSLAAGTASPYNPKPDKDDWILPMPNGAEMVFKRVTVPGKSFWGDERRVIQVGDGEGGIFEGVQRAQVSGSFPGKSGDSWLYYLGKYELTMGQFSAIMGLEALIVATGDSSEKAKLKKLEGKKLEKHLRRPLVFVSWHDIQLFLQHYNNWLFDPGYPERITNLPRVAGVPGFLRLPSELEWEYAARGGLPALEDGSFKNSLPFPKAKMPVHAWYLKNAKHKVRPIGLRKPNRLGLYDMLGNAQELTNGPFLPEIWQGKPGGLVARGGSVATSGTKMRSSRREEVEIYKWVEDSKQMCEWRSYNTGLRLVIGSNVVLNPKNRKTLEAEHREYLGKIRNRMPVGKTLDNFVTQAAGQLGDANTNLEELIKKSPNLSEQLSRIRRDIEKAEEQLNFAMRESARSTSRNALREATDLGRDLFKLHSFHQRLKDVERLTAISTRYNDMKKTLEEEITKREGIAREILVRYLEHVGELSGFGKDYVKQALDELAKKRLTRRSSKALEVLTQHVQQFRNKRRLNQYVVMQEFETRFKELSD